MSRIDRIRTILNNRIGDHNLANAIATRHIEQVLAEADDTTPLLSEDEIREVIRLHSILGDEVDGVFYCGYCGQGDAGTPTHLAEVVYDLQIERMNSRG